MSETVQSCVIAKLCNLKTELKKYPWKLLSSINETTVFDWYNLSMVNYFLVILSKLISLQFLLVK